MKVSWNDVGVSEVFLNKHIRSAESENMKHFPISYLIHHFVFHNRFKPIGLYACVKCRHKHHSSTDYETHSVCLKCGHKVLSLTKILNFKCKKDYTLGRNVKDVILKINENYSAYFKKPSGDILKTSWNHGIGLFESEFVDIGEKVYDKNSNFSIVKAALLCPFLWDTKFDFNTKTRHKHDVSSFVSRLILCNLNNLHGMSAVSFGGE